MAKLTSATLAVTILSLVAGACGGPARQATVDTGWMESALDGPEEGLPVRLTKGAQAAPAGDKDTDSAALAARTCLAHLLTGLFACEPRRLDAFDRDAPGDAPDCAVPLDRAYVVASKELGALSKAGRITDIPAGVREPLELCAGASALFRSMAVSSAALALALISWWLELSGGATSNALLGIGAWSRAAFFAQASPVFGGRLDESEALFERGVEAAGPLKAWVLALEARTLCAARQARACAKQAIKASRDAHAVAAVRRVADRWLLWVEQRDGLLFGPQDERPATSDGGPSAVGAQPPADPEPAATTAEATGP